jgi:hypothetical protein
MNLSNEFSTIEFTDTKLKTTNRKNLYKVQSQKIYNDISYDSIKEVTINRKFNSKIHILPFFYFLGITFMSSGFKKKVYTQPWLPEYESRYILVDTSSSEKIGMFIFSLCIIGLGFIIRNKYFKNIDGCRAITIKYLDGKQKSLKLFYSKDEDELIKVKNEIEERMKISSSI